MRGPAAVEKGAMLACMKGGRNENVLPSAPEGMEIYRPDFILEIMDNRRSTHIRSRRGPMTRDEMPRIAIEPLGPRFRVLIDGFPVRETADEMDAHHWGKHAFEAVQTGLSTPAAVSQGMAELCREATVHNLHS